VTKKSVSQEDLVTGKLYPWTPSGYAGEPITKLLPVSNTRGIRVATRSDGSIALVVLYDTAEQSEWPNSFDEKTGIMTYYGDNRDLDKPFDSGFDSFQQFANLKSPFQHASVAVEQVQFLLK
jgi:hypothetical protein